MDYCSVCSKEGKDFVNTKYGHICSTKCFRELSADVLGADETDFIKEEPKQFYTCSSGYGYFDDGETFYVWEKNSPTYHYTHFLVEVDEAFLKEALSDRERKIMDGTTVTIDGETRTLKDLPL